MDTLIPTLKPVSELVSMFQAGDIAVPEIQRDVVWNADQVKALIDSIGRGYPCGSLILWQPRPKDHAVIKSMIRPERLEQLRGKLPRYLLLDGQQRLTALASVMLRRDEFKEIVVELDEEMPFILANLKHFPNEIEATTDISRKFPWVLYNELFDGTAQAKPDYGTLNHEQTKKIERHLQTLRGYTFPVQIICDRDYATVGEIFTRVNSQGTQLTGAEIYLAQIVPHWPGVTKELRNYRKDLKLRNYDFDLTFLMRAITVVECRTPQIKKLAEKVRKVDRPKPKHLNQSWTRARVATDKLIKILQSELLLDRSKFFTSKNALVPLLFHLANPNGKAKPASKLIQRFFILSQLAEHYGSGAETALRKDFRIIADPDVTPRQGLSELVASVDRDARQFYRGLKIKPGDVCGMPSKNVLILLMYILMRRRGARDWGKNGKPLSEIEPKQMQLHHIFPFDFITKDKSALQAYLDNDYSPADFRAEVNDIANLTFLSQAENVAIGNQPPWQYLPEHTTKDALRAHFIPTDPALWKPERYAEFLEERRRLLATALSGLIKKLK